MIASLDFTTLETIDTWSPTSSMTSGPLYAGTTFTRWSRL